MSRFPRLTLVLLASTLAWLGFSFAPVPDGVCRADEMAERFVEGLRAKGHHQMAIYYLEKMRDSPLVDDEFREKIDYEAGLTMLDAARTGRVPAIREKHLEEARRYFDKFVTEHGGHPLLFSARSQLANVLFERGRIQREAAEEADDAAQREAMMAEVRQVLEKAQQLFSVQKDQSVERHAAFGNIDPNDAAKIEERNQVRKDILESRMALAAIEYELALTMPPDSEEYAKQMQVSADAYNELYGDYSNMLAGLYAQMFEARSYKKLGKNKEAMSLLEQLLMQPEGGPPLRTLQNKALVLYLEAALDAKEYKKAMDASGQWIDKARGAEEQSIEGLAIKFHGAKAAIEYAAGLDESKPEEEKLRRKTLAAARKALQAVAATPSEFQREARQMLATMGVIKEGEPTTFAEARDRGREALDRMQAESLSAAEQREAQQQAMEMFQLALRLVDAETDPTAINIVRYYLTFLHYTEGNYLRAALIGEFLASKYPQEAVSRQAAMIALACYAKMQNEGPAKDEEFCRKKMNQIATLVTKRWPDEPEAGDAWMALVRDAVRRDELEQARDYIANIPESSPKRGEGELLIGRTMWGRYVRAARATGENRPLQKDLDAMLEEAREVLAAGVNRMKQAVGEGGEVDYPLLASTLALAQIHINLGESQEAVALLTDEQLGPLTLVEQEHPATTGAERETLRVETYKAALRAYVGTQQLEEAEAVMAALEDTLTGDDEEAQSRLTRVYISLGRDLEEQLDMLRKQNKTAEQQRVSKGFELFLTKIYQRPGNTFGSLNWVAETFLGMAQGLDPGGEKLPPNVKNYYQRAGATFQQILKKLKSDPSFGPEGAEASVNVRFARVLRRLGHHDQAHILLLRVLRDHPMMLDAQKECAYAYQERGEENPVWYKLAMLGSRKYDFMWGWGRMGNRLARNEQHRDTFHEARYNLAYCRMQYALSRVGKNRDEMLGKAESDIVIVSRLFPEMGGDVWRDKYDKLLKDIQQLLGKTPSGLAGLEEEDETPQDSATAAGSAQASK